jgi:mono/diheme cytochrome c family protein
MKTITTSLASLILLVVMTGRPVGAATSGADTYKAKCAACHGQDGSGDTPLGKRMKVRDLRSAEVQKQSTEAITAIVQNGQKAMPAFGKSLAPEQIKDVVTFVRSIAAK